MPWFGNIRSAWRFVLSNFTQDRCDRCHQKKLNVMFRWRFERKLCDQCWVALRKAHEPDPRRVPRR
jgi:recombinational DNA repair protein (RecF pathway)